MSWFKYKGITSFQMGIEVLKQPPVLRAPMRYELSQIDGRDGGMVKRQGYDAVPLTLDVFYSRMDLRDEISAWLTGSGKLILSTDRERYQWADVVDMLTYEHIARQGKGKITFLVQPYRYYEETYTTATTVYNRGNVDALPLIKVTGTETATLAINEQAVCSISLANGMVTLDSEAEEAYCNGNRNNRLVSGRYPVLKPGSNRITWTGNMTKVETLTRSRWI